MKKQQPQTGAFQNSLPENAEKANYVLRLYLTGMTPQSMEALAVIKEICEERLDGRYDLEVIDIYQQRHLAKDERIIALPTLIKTLPLPRRRLVGNLADKERVLLGLDLDRKD
jgi:circadian clock protein KaiB